MRSNIGVLAATFATTIALQVPLEYVPTCMPAAAQSGYQGPGFYNIFSLLSPSNVAVDLSYQSINSSVVAE